MNFKDLLKEPLMPVIIILGIANFIVYFVVGEGTNTWDLATSIPYDATALVSAICMFYVYRFYGGKSFEGRFWMLTGVGMFLWFVAEVAWFYYVINDIAPFPSIADVFFLAAYFPIIVAVVNRSKFSKITFNSVKAAIVAVCILIVLVPTYIWVLHPIFVDTSYGTVEKVVSIAYPVLDLILLGFAVTIALYWGSKISYGWYILSLGIVLMTVADILFAAMEWNGVYYPKIELAYAATYLLMGVAALYQKKYHESFL